MAHPNDKTYVVPDGVKEFIYAYPGQKRKCYTEGDEVRMSPQDYALCMPWTEEEVKKAGGFPSLKGGEKAQAYMDTYTYTIEPGDAVCLTLAKDFGECAPSKLKLDWKEGMCVRTNLDTQLTPELLANNPNGNGATLNQELHDVSVNPLTCEAPEKFYIYNTNETPLVVNVTPLS